MNPLQDAPKVSQAAADTIRLLLDVATEAKSAIRYLSPKLVVKATHKNRPAIRRDERNHIEFIVTIGKPNYAERKFIKLCQKAGEPFPVAKTQLKFYPKKAGKA